MSKHLKFRLETCPSTQYFARKHGQAPKISLGNMPKQTLGMHDRRKTSTKINCIIKQSISRTIEADWKAWKRPCRNDSKHSIRTEPVHPMAASFWRGSYKRTHTENSLSIQIPYLSTFLKYLIILKFSNVSSLLIHSEAHCSTMQGAT